jgi:hypothetical protein
MSIWRVLIVWKRVREKESDRERSREREGKINSDEAELQVHLPRSREKTFLKGNGRVDDASLDS